MSFDGFLFSLKNAVYNIFRNYVLTIASVIVLSVCLLSLGSTFLVVEDVGLFQFDRVFHFGFPLFSKNQPPRTIPGWLFIRS